MRNLFQLINLMVMHALLVLPTTNIKLNNLSYSLKDLTAIGRLFCFVKSDTGRSSKPSYKSSICSGSEQIV